MNKTSQLKKIPICRFSMISTACVAILVGAGYGVEPWVVFQRAFIGTCIVGTLSFFARLWFETVFN